MLDAASLDRIAAYCVRFGAVALCDEVWEHVVFDGAVHLPLMARPGMAERTVKIGSAGKIFALTGWKVGWVIAAPSLARVIARAHQFLTFTTPPNLQRAAAFGLGKDDAYFIDMRAGLGRSRDRLVAALTAQGYVLDPAAGTYFVSIDLAASGIAPDDVAFCNAILDHGVAAIPVSAFYAANPATGRVRLCFAKRDAVLDAAAERLGQARARLA
jgi:aspartate/methionine/tyrosine aminotransferase